jgi:hypothetical protein
MAFTKTQVDNTIDKDKNPFRQDIAGSNSIAITGGAEARFVINGLARDDSQGPAYMTDRWDTVNNKFAAPTEPDGPVYVADLGFIWTPSASSEGTIKIRLYIDDTVPKLIRTYRSSYKGSDAEPYSVVTTWYLGTEVGYDAKNDGVYFTVEFENNGTITSPSAVIYNTQ